MKNLVNRVLSTVVLIPAARIAKEFTFVEFDSDAIPEGVTLHPDPENQALPSEAFEAVSE